MDGRTGGKKLWAQKETVSPTFSHYGRLLKKCVEYPKFLFTGAKLEL
jgi:hypothetical protein